MEFDATEKGDENVEAAVSALYHELRAVAAAHMSRERPNHTLQPTALVHEAYLRLSKQRHLKWENRIHFLHIAASEIRRILVDHARAKGRQKRGGDRVQVTLSDNIAAQERECDLIELDQVLNRLNENSIQDRQIVELKFFAGLTEAEIAAALNMGERTVRRRWLFVRSWLFCELGESDDH